MKLILTILLSLLLAGLFCLVLVRKGILQPSTDLNHSVGSSLLSRSYDQTPPLPVRAQDDSRIISPQTKELPQTVTMVDPPLLAPAAPDEQQILTYLTTTAGQPSFEENLRRYLDEDCRFNPAKSETYLRMILWKNFVTLQHSWQPGEVQELLTAFIVEKNLKKAGFAARGLELMADELSLAEIRLQEIIGGLEEKVLTNGGT